jgi:hypothetical protein
MKFPQRVDQHIAETISFKIFSSKIPDNWIVRDLTGRDYGIDCYLEIVNENNELTGELALIQLKSVKAINWNERNEFNLPGIKISTSNYWFGFAVPVFIFITDIEKQDLYFTSVGYNIRRNFDQFVKQETFSYKIKKRDKFEGADGVFSFKFMYYYDKLRPRFEDELLFFLSSVEQCQEFISHHWARDFHLGVDGQREFVFLETFYRNYKFLSSYLNVDWNIPSIAEYKIRSQKKFGLYSVYELYEHDMAEIVRELDKKTIEIVKSLKEFLHGEMAFWKHTNPTIYRFVQEIKDDGALPN